jgi:hypothetical protein
MTPTVQFAVFPGWCVRRLATPAPPRLALCRLDDGDERVISTFTEFPELLVPVRGFASLQERLSWTIAVHESLGPALTMTPEDGHDFVCAAQAAGFDYHKGDLIYWLARRIGAWLSQGEPPA